jgi:PAS domain S-box-containing protein
VLNPYEMKRQNKDNPRHSTLPNAFNISFIYALSALIWIVSTNLLNYLNSKEELSAFYNDFLSGLFFVLVTSVILYFAINRSQRVIHEKSIDIKNSKRELSSKSNYLNTVVNAAPMSVFDLDIDGKVAGIWNHASEKMFGWTAEETIGNYLPIIQKDKREEFESRLREGLKGRHLRLKNVLRKKKSGDDIYININTCPVPGKENDKVRILAFIEDVTQKIKYEDEIRKLSEAVKQSPDSVMIVGLDGTIEYVNPKFTEISGYPLEEAFGRNPFVLLQGKDDPATVAEIGEKISSGESWKGEFFNTKKNGEKYWVSVTIGPVKDEKGTVTNLVAVEQDITEEKIKDRQLKETLKEKEIMFKEIHHRVKNNLQIVSSLLNMQADICSNPETLDALNITKNRILSMALVHENLYKSDNMNKIKIGNYVEMLSKNIYFTYGVDYNKVKLNLNANGVEVNLDTSIPVGLMLNELISNSLKHAFPGDLKGDISVEFKNLSGGYYFLRVKDNGVGLPENFDPGNHNTLGINLIKLLNEQLDGELAINGHNGTDVSVKFKELRYRLKK